MKTDGDLNWDAIEPGRSRLRSLVARVARELETVEGQAQGARSENLALAWANLVGELDLGVEPLLRECPHCLRSILTAAVRCRYCMNRSPAAGTA